MLIYLGVFFILPDNIRRKNLTLFIALGGFALALYGIYRAKHRDGFMAGQGCGASGQPCSGLCNFTANISASGALSNISTSSCGLIQGMTIQNSKSTLPANITLSSYSAGSTNGQLSGASSYTAGSDTFTGSIAPYCMINEKDLPKSDVDQTVIFNIYGRYVRVYPSASASDGYMGLSQVVVNDATGANIALNRPTTAVSTYPGVGASSVGVDGNIKPRSWPALWHNSGGRNDYWQVDLGSIQMVTTVRIIARIDYGETNGVKTRGDIDRTNGIRVVVLQNTSDIPTTVGVCIPEPTPIYPTGTTIAEQDIIKPIIMAGQNGQAALNIYRALVGGTKPSSLTSYGLTDSQSAAAYLKLQAENLIGQHNSGSLNDTQYFAATNGLKGITTMAGINFNASQTLTTYMSQHLINTKVPTKNADGSQKVDSSGNLVYTTISDGGAAQTVATIISATKPSSVDPSAAYSGTTTPDTAGLVSAPPATGSWSSNALAQLPQQPVAITPPSQAPIIVSPATTPAQITAAATTGNPTLAGQTPSSTAMSGAAGAALTAAGYAAPAAGTVAAMNQWYQIGGYSYNMTTGAAACAAYGGKMATHQQVIDAQASGASVCSAGLVSDDPAHVYFPGQPGNCWGDGMHQQNMGESISCCGGNWAVNCYGPKPPPGTPGVLVWTDQAVTKAGSTYAANDWSKKVNNVPLGTQEVFWVGFNGYTHTKADAQSICQANGGDLATLAQLTNAQAKGAQWCAAGWLKDVNTPRWPMQNGSISGCGGATVNDYGATGVAGANCFGVKPSQGASVSATLPNGNLTQTISIATTGRYVRVRASLTSGVGAYLHLSQIVVKDVNGNNISRGKTTRATSTLSGSGPPSNVVDGNEQPRPWNGGNPLSGNIWHCQNTVNAKNDNEWWEVDLGSEQQIASITYYGRSDCCYAGTGDDRITGTRIEIAHTPYPTPFSSYSDPVAWSQNSYVNTQACPSGTFSQTCDGVTACVNNGTPSCTKSCPSGTTYNSDAGKCKPN
jgi:hypothetical protein